jgi:putative copper export protein
VGTQYRFWGWVAIITLLVTGPVMLSTFYGIPPQQMFDPSLHSSGFGRALAVKLALVILIVVSALVHDFWIGPRARNSPGFSKIARLVGRANLIIALLIVVFAVILRAGGL